MRQDMADHEGSGTISARALTHDEVKAAEAAFRGEPFNPTWSAAAEQVYTGISAALANRESAALSQAGTESAYEYIGC